LQRSPGAVVAAAMFVMTLRSHTACDARLPEDWRLTGSDASATGVLTPSGAAGGAGVAVVNTGPTLEACGFGFGLGAVVAPHSVAARAVRPLLLATPSGNVIDEAPPAAVGEQLGQCRSAATGDATAKAVAVKQCPAAAARSGKPLLPQVGHT